MNYKETTTQNASTPEQESQSTNHFDRTIGKEELHEEWRTVREAGKREANGKMPQVLLPHDGRNDSKFAKEIALTLRPDILFKKDEWIVELATDEVAESPKFNIMIPA